MMYVYVLLSSILPSYPIFPSLPPLPNRAISRSFSHYLPGPVQDIFLLILRAGFSWPLLLAQGPGSESYQKKKKNTRNT